MPDPTNADPTNVEIAAALEELADLYELDGAIVHRVLAYRNAARAVREAPTSVATLARQGRATELAGIGETIQEKVLALIGDGAIPAAVRLRERYPPGLVELTHLPGLGPRRARRLFEELGIDSPRALREAIAEHRVRELKGFGARAEERLLQALDAARSDPTDGRMRLDRALAAAEPLIAQLKALPGVLEVHLAGSLRRMTETVKDLDVAIAAQDPLAVARAAAGLEAVQSAGSPSATGVRLRLHSGLDAELRLTRPQQLGNLLQHLTGSAAHNAALREGAVRRGLHVSEHGLLDDNTGLTHHCASEAELYALLGLAYIEPELREGRGELEAAAAGTLPRLIEQRDLRGDLHCHTVASDGHTSIEAMASAARLAGYEYLAITDHSASMGFGAEVSPERLREQIERIRATRLEGIELLAGSEVNILPDGSLDYADELLERLDWVIASVHTSMQMGRERMTARLVRAIQHPLVDAIAHPTGRMIGSRPPYEIDLDAVLEACARTGTMLEINANPARRDLDEHMARAAAAAGVAIVINSDAHRPESFALIRYGVATARRAWLSAAQVANTRPWPELRARRPRQR
jgi:DNA polymerase (family 10)